MRGKAAPSATTASEVGRVTGADDRNIDGRIGDRPRDRELRERDLVGGGVLLQPSHQLEISRELLTLEVGAAAAPVVRGECRLLRHRPGKQPVSKRTVDEDTDVVLRRVRKDFRLDVAVEHVVWRLIGLDRPVLGELCHLTRAVVGNARVPDLPFAHEIGERTAGLLGRRRGVRPVHLVEIDVVRPQIPKARVDAFTQPARARISLQPVAFFAKATLRRDDDAVSRHPRPERVREKTLGRSETVGLGGIEERDPEVERPSYGLFRLVGVKPAPIAAE